MKTDKPYGVIGKKPVKSKGECVKLRNDTPSCKICMANAPVSFLLSLRV